MNKRFVSLAMALLTFFVAAPLPVDAVTNRVKQPTVFTKEVTFQSTAAITGNQTVGGTLGVTGNTTVGGTLGVTGAATFTVPITAANVNTSVKRETLVLNFAGGELLVDGKTYVCSIPMRRAGTVKAINVSAHTRMAGGTNTLAFAKKQGSTSVTLISTATVDPTAFPTAADTAEAATLTSTGADLIFAAGDCLKSTLVCGTMTTDGQGYAVAIDVEYTDV